MKRHHLLLLPLLAALLAMSGCSLFSKMFNRGGNIEQPKPLVEFTPTVQVQELWSTSVGDGAGRSGVRLEPALADGKLYVVSTDGEIQALDAATGKVIWQQSTKMGGGACGYLLKTIEGDALAQSIRRAMGGENVIAAEMTGKLVSAFQASSATAPGPAAAPSPIDTLSPRELEIVRLIARGASNKEIGRDLGIAETTVKIHVQHVLRKLDLNSRVQAAVYASEHGLR